jgi:hypothetical protein
MLQHARLIAAQHHVQSRAEAARAVCGDYLPPPNVTVCFLFTGASLSANDRANATDGLLLPRHGHHTIRTRAMADAINDLEATGVEISNIVDAVQETDCETRGGVESTILRIRLGHRWALPLWPFCFYRWQNSSLHFETVDASEDRRWPVGDRSCRESSTRGRTDAALPRVALGIGGLARTFPHPLVYKSLRGHVVDALGVEQTRVFAALRLDDDRPVSGGGNGAAMGTTMRRALAADVMRALEYLGADERDVLLQTDASVSLPACIATRTTISASSNGEALVPEGSPPTSDRRHNTSAPHRPCGSYFDACALPAVAGQLWSRRNIYTLLVAHEARVGVPFSSLLFVRPDILVAVPLPPAAACSYSSPSPRTNASYPMGRYYADWLVWLPRQAVDGAFRDASADFDACRIRFAEGAAAGLNPEAFLLAAAERHGVSIAPLNESEPLVVAIVRPNLGAVTPPAGFICSAFARSLKLAADATGQSSHHAGVSPLGAFQPLFYRGRAAEARFPRQVPTCTRLLHRNPSNALDPASTHEPRR